MVSPIKILSMVVAVLFFLPDLTGAAECSSGDLPEPLIELIMKKKYADAEARAKEALANAPDDLRANQVLMNVLINSAIREVIHLDTTKLGFKPGESGMREITSEQMKAAASPRTFVDTEYKRKAEIQFDVLLRRWADQVDYYYCLTKIQFYSGDHEKFIRYLDLTAKSHAKLEKEAIDFLVGYGRKYIKEKRPRMAAEVYDTLLMTFPHSAPALSSLGVVWLRRGDSAKAATYFDKAYQSDSKDIIVVGNIAEIAMLRGDFQRAEIFLQRKLSLQRENQTATYFDLAMNAMRRGPKASLPYWEQYFDRNKVHPDDAWWSKVAENIYQSVKEGKLDDEGQLDLASQMIQAGAPKYAVPIMFYMRKKHPRNAAYSYVLAQAYDTGGYYDLGERAIVDTMALKRKNPGSLSASLSQIHYNHSRFLYQLERKDEALAALSYVDTGDNAYSSALYMYAVIYRDNNKLDKARTYLQQCIDKAGNNPVKSKCESFLAGLNK